MSSHLLLQSIQRQTVVTGEASVSVVVDNYDDDDDNYADNNVLAVVIL